MIESKEQLLGDFLVKAEAFLQQPNLIAGIDLDDAAVTLKRYVLTVEHNQEIASLLARFPKLIRTMDVAALAPMVAQVREQLQQD